MKKTPIKIKTTKECVVCGKTFKLFKTTDKYCSLNCAKKDAKQPQTNTKLPSKLYKIKQHSDKTKKRINQYYKQRKEFLSRPENKCCFIDGCAKIADTIEHTKGRKGYADKYARDNNIPLLLDERFWKPCCLTHNLQLESDSELSHEYQLSKIHEGKKIKK